MILIISEQEDPTVDEVVRWLGYYEQSYVRINDEDQIEIHNLEFSNESINFNIQLKEKIINYAEIESVYYRRGYLKIKNIGGATNSNKLNFFLDHEERVFSDFIHYLIEQKPCLGKFERNGPNKLKVLHTAASIGFKTPRTLITSLKKELSEFICQSKSIITKAIFEPVNFSIGNYSVSQPTESVKTKDLKLLPNKFLKTLYQEEVEKDYEIRTFYLMGKTYSIAIFSQSNDRTRVDFRNYDEQNPNRMIAVELPKDLIFKIDKLMNKLDYNTGSIDFIFSKGDYYFLEVNPVGQFGMVSYPTGYNLEKKVADLLISLKDEA